MPDIPTPLADAARKLLASPALQEFLPFLILFAVPSFVLLARAPAAYLLRTLTMFFDSLVSLWSRSPSSSGSSTSSRKLKKKGVRTRAEQQAQQNGHADPKRDMSTEDGYYPGIVNISGTYCFMDSTLQALASLSYLQPYLDAIIDKAVALDVPTPVVDAVQDILRKLNTPKPQPSALRPVEIIAALTKHNERRQNTLFGTREHQDAQELFQLVSECIKNEALAVEREGQRDRGFGELALDAAVAKADLSRTVFDGLTANRRSCMECGYTEAVMHFGFDNWHLAVPRSANAVRLEDCIADYTKLEILTDCVCRKCSLVATHRKLLQDAARATAATEGDDNPSSSKRRRAREVRKLESRVKQALQDGRIEEDIKGVKMEKVYSRASTKQAMIARPPPVLAIHLNRSLHYGGSYAAKNTQRIVFPEILDLTPYTTSGSLSTQPSLPISSTPPPSDHPQRSTTPTPQTYNTPRTLYRLAAVVCHYGDHSFGHYVCYRRKPRGGKNFTPRVECPRGCTCDQCARWGGPVRDAGQGGEKASGAPGSGRGWLRISDDAVREVGIEQVLAEQPGAFMLYYERAAQPRLPARTGGMSPQPQPQQNAVRSSQETVRPRAEVSPSVMFDALQAGAIAGAPTPSEIARASFGPARVVRSVAAGAPRARSFSPALPHPGITSGGGADGEGGGGMQEHKSERASIVSGPPLPIPPPSNTSPYPLVRGQSAPADRLQQQQRQYTNGSAPQMSQSASGRSKASSSSGTSSSLSTYALHKGAFMPARPISEMDPPTSSSASAYKPVVPVSAARSPSPAPASALSVSPALAPAAASDPAPAPPSPMERRSSEESKRGQQQQQQGRKPSHGRPPAARTVGLQA